MITQEDDFEIKDGKVKLTRDIIKRGRSINGGWSNKQFKCLGVSNPNKAQKGWKKHLENLCDIGEVWLPILDVLLFLKLKDAHLIKQKSIEGIAARYGKINQEVIDGKIIYYFLEQEVSPTTYYAIKKMYADLNRFYNYS